MNKLWLIIKREYTVRVLKRTFLLTTFLTPLLFVGFGVLAGMIASSGKDNLHLIVKDGGNNLFRYGTIADEDNLFFQIDTTTDLETLKNTYAQNGKDGIVYIRPVASDRFFEATFELEFFSNKKIGLETKNNIENKVARLAEDVKITKSGYDRTRLKSFETDVKLVSAASADGSKNADIARASILGGIMGILIYSVIFIYGMMVMRSVMEEKTNRISEVMVSSVRPIQLMLGKIIGVGAVGITQLLIWAILIPTLTFLSGIIFGFGHSSPVPAGVEMPSQDDTQTMMAMLQSVLTFNYAKVISFFILFFIGGYMLYASLFAAVGSAVGDDLGESQSLTIPITIPVVLSFYIALSVINNPESSLAFWASMFPLFSPIVMTTRLAFDPPLWQILLSLFILFASCVGVAWVAGRIYRVGILMYGKKVSFKELGKWLFYKD